VSKTAMTVADLDLMPDDGNRYELIEGELYVSRSPGLAHRRSSWKLSGTLFVYLEANPIGEALATPGVIFDDINGVIPDLVYFSNERRDEIAAGTRISGAPDLVVEIVSPGSENERRDRVVKRDLYAKFGVREYWLLDPVLRCVEVHRHDGRTLRTVGVLGPEDVLTSPLLPGYSVKVADLFPQ
jgi:Uma2 family endonuclease